MSSPNQTLSLKQALSLGVTHLQSGRLKPAERVFQAILSAHPLHAGAHHYLGVIAFRTGRLETALSHLNQALEQQPNLAEAHFILGNVYKKLAQQETAEQSYRQALAIKPDFPIVLNNLGELLHEMERFGEAEACFRRAVEIKPQFAAACNNLGKALRDLGRFKEAEACYRRALALKPAYQEALYGLANMCRVQRLNAEAESTCRRALEINPDSPQALNILGRILQGQNRLAEAEASFHRALEAQADFVDAHISLGVMFEQSGHIQKAKSHLQKALTHSPNNLMVRNNLAKILRREGRIEEAIEMLKTVTLEQIRTKRAFAIPFELGKLYDKVHDTPNAFKQFTHGNELVSETEDAKLADKEKTLRDIDQKQTLLTWGWVDSWNKTPHPAKAAPPFFLVGFPRSGTTLLDQVLNSHPALQVMEEKPCLDVVQNTLLTLPGGYPSLADLTETQLQELRNIYFRETKRYLPSDPNAGLVDKLPLNIMHIPLIIRLFPNARIVLSLRHPCDVVLSNFMQDYQINDAMANFFTLEDAVHYYTKVMGLWQACQTLPSGYFHTIKYESLLVDLPGEIGKLLDFLELDWDDAVLDYRSQIQKRGIINTPSYAQVTEPIYQSAKYRWKRYEAQLKPYIGSLAPFIKAFGYAE
ncbi:MAG: tetratricopeptide repeat protein [Magnetococcales bacterium]|nr:tetratricopeptide repeat protein [Magnetococcales bacterium]